MTSVCVLLFLALVANVNGQMDQPNIQSSSSLFIAGQERTLVCYISSTETPTSFPLSWSKDGYHLSASNEEIIPYASTGVTNYNSFYKLMVQPSDNIKVYVCTATFPSGQTTSLFRIYVDKGPDTPVITGPSQIVTGQRVSWTCVVDGASSTAPNVYWQFGNGTRLASSLFTSSNHVYIDNNKLEIHKETSVLTMTVSSGSPSFTLSCQAVHFETSTKTTADVSVTVNCDDCKILG